MALQGYMPTYMSFPCVYSFLRVEPVLKFFPQKFFRTEFDPCEDFHMTLSKGAVINMSPEAATLAIGESIRVSVRSSTSYGGYATVNIKRMTEEYYYVSTV